MHLPTTEINALIVLLRDIVPAITEAWVESVIAPLPPAFRHELPAMAVGANVLDRVATILFHANNAGYLTSGQLPLVVILETADITTTSQAVQNAVRRLRTLVGSVASGGPAITVDRALSDVRVAGATLFADRDVLRKQLRRLHEPDGLPAVVVNGESQVGKTHTRMLLAHAAMQTRAFVLAWVEIKKEQAADFTADWLAEELVHSVVPGATGMPTVRTPKPRWHGDLANWVWTELSRAAAGADVWILVDGLGLDNVHEDVRDVVARLAMRAGTPTLAPRLRLVLINCDPLEIRRAGCVAEEERFGHLTLADAENCLQGLVQAQFNDIWGRVRPMFEGVPTLTTPIVGEMMREAIR